MPVSFSNHGGRMSLEGQTDLTMEQMEQVAVSAEALTNSSLTDLILTLGIIRLIRRAGDPDFVQGQPIHYVVLGTDPGFTVGIKITNCPSCIREMSGGEDAD